MSRQWNVEHDRQSMGDNGALLQWLLSERSSSGVFHLAASPALAPSTRTDLFMGTGVQQGQPLLPMLTTTGATLLTNLCIEVSQQQQESLPCLLVYFGDNRNVSVGL